jgi:condensin complex subunit 1
VLIGFFRLTYDATLAELTSLEETMRSMMNDGQIHQDVIANLWEVYSSYTQIAPCPTILLTLFIGSDKQLPKPQRRGAIIILGMLALARRSVVTERVDTLLRVGLGPLGKVGSGVLTRLRFFFDGWLYPGRFNSREVY